MEGINKIEDFWYGIGIWYGFLCKFYFNTRQICKYKRPSYSTKENVAQKFSGAEIFISSILMELVSTVIKLLI